MDTEKWLRAGTCFSCSWASKKTPHSIHGEDTTLPNLQVIAFIRHIYVVVIYPTNYNILSDFCSYIIYFPL